MSVRLRGGPERSQGSTSAIHCSQCQGLVDVKEELLQSGTTPPVCTLCLHDVTACDQISQTFPLHICVLQVIKHWKWQRPWNEAMLLEFGNVLFSLQVMVWHLVESHDHM